MVLSERQQDAVEALVDAVESLGLRACVGPERGGAVVIVLADGTSTIFQVTSVALVTRDSAPGQLQRRPSAPNGDLSGVVVADRINRRRAGSPVSGRVELARPSRSSEIDGPRSLRRRERARIRPAAVGP